MKMMARVAIAVVVGWVGAAHAVTLVTPPLPFPVGGELDCRLVNVSSKPIDVTTELIDQTTGAPAASLVCNGLPPNGACSAGAAPVLGYCRFEVSKGNRRSVRAVITSETSEVTAALEAR